MDLASEVFDEGFVERRDDDHARFLSLGFPWLKKCRLLLKGHPLPTPSSVAGFRQVGRGAGFRLNLADSGDAEPNRLGRLRFG